MKKIDYGLVPTYRIALVQMASDFLDRKANLDRAEMKLREAVSNGAKLVCFPESFDLGYTNTRISELVNHIPETQNLTLTKMCDLAKELNTHILVPTFFRDHSGNVYNAAFLVDDEGAVVGSYFKTHLTPDENNHVTRGMDYPVFDTKLGKIGIAICYDICFPEVCRLLALNGAQLILVPAAWRNSKHYSQWWDLNLSCRALDDLVYVAGINRIGPANETEEFAGKSQLCSPTGEKLCHCGAEDTIVYADVDLRCVEEERKSNTVLADRHPLDYRRICVQ